MSAETTPVIWHKVADRVTDPADLDDAIAEALAHEGPAFVDIVTDPELV